MYDALYQLLTTIFVMMLAGFLLQKTGVVTAEGKKSLANIILYLVLPCNIIKAFCMEFSPESFGPCLRFSLRP